MLGRPAAWTAVQPSTGRWAAAGMMVPLQQQQQQCKSFAAHSGPGCSLVSLTHTHCVCACMASNPGPAELPLTQTSVSCCLQVVAIVGQLIGNAK